LEWSKFLMLHAPCVRDGKLTIQHIFDIWKDEACIDSGEVILVPLTPSKQWAILLAGGVAGAVSRTATAPLDRLKTLIQTNSTNRYNFGILQGLKQIWKSGGILAFYRGNFANCLKIVPESGTKFLVYERCKYLFSLTFGDAHPALQKFLAGAVAGAVSQTLVFPLDCMKVRMAVSPTKMNIFQALQNTYASGGIRAFYRGLVPNIIGVVPYAGIDLAVYETLKKFYTDAVVKRGYNAKKHQSKMSIFIPFLCGTFSCVVAQFVSYPLTLARTRLQAHGMQDSEKYTGTIDVFRRTVQRDGWSGLYRGMVPNMVKVVPAVGISYVVYERVKIIVT